jgi:hypothetical protein
MSRSRAVALAEHALARAAEGLDGGAGGRVLRLSLEVRPYRTDEAALADAIARAVRAAIRPRLEGREPL